MVTVHGNYVQFRFFRPDAQSVCLAGDFNGWRTGQFHMVPVSGGYWVAAFRLPAGSYRFRYLADGRWFTDYAAFGIEYGPYGPDSIVRVAEQKSAAPASTEADDAQEDDSSSREPAVLSFEAAMAGVGFTGRAA